MRNVDTKVDGVDSMPAANYNAQRVELENAVLSADITLDLDAGPDTDLNMLGKAMAAYANAGNVYQDSGVADAYVLSITTNLKTVPKYYDNMMVMFKVGATNTGASTVNVNTLGVKSLTLSDGTALAAGNITAGRYVLANYSLSNDRFELVTGAPASSLEYNVYIHATDGDYPTLAAYLASVPVAGDSVLYDADETSAVQIEIPIGIKIKQVYGRVLTFNTALADAAFKTNKNCKILGRFNIHFSHAGTIDTALELGGSFANIDNFYITCTGTPTVTNVVILNSGLESTYCQINLVAALAVTNVVVDSSTNVTNDVSVLRETDKIYHSDLGIVKAWGNWTGATPPAKVADYNVTSVTRTAEGKFTITWATDFASAAYSIMLTIAVSTTSSYIGVVVTQAAGSCTIEISNEAGTLRDPDNIHFMAMGLQ